MRQYLTCMRQVIIPDSPTVIVIFTRYNGLIREGYWETLVFNRESASKSSLIERISSFDSAQQQHEAVVTDYSNMGYSTIVQRIIVQPDGEQQDSGLERTLAPGWNDKLKGIPGLDQL